MTIEQIQSLITAKGDLREIVNELADYIQANPGGSPGGGSLLSATVTLNDAEIKNNPSVYIKLLDPPGADKIIIVTSTIFIQRCSGGAYTNIHSAAYFLLVYGEEWLENASGLVIPNSGANNVFTPVPIYTTDGIGGGVGMTGEINSILESVVNQPIYVALQNPNGNLTGGNAANTLEVTAYYTVYDLL